MMASGVWLCGRARGGPVLGTRGATLETTLGRMVPPKSGRVQESHLMQVAFYGVVHFWEVPFALMLSPGWRGRRRSVRGADFIWKEN
jgi:hypothetical protein